jgi:ubiquinone/menaquinone biosynthesis C-methylase UbiE
MFAHLEVFMTTSHAPQPRDGEYVMGHSPLEYERLEIQARVMQPLTESMFRNAGISPGMRVLDIGSGVGDVAFLARDFVGELGEVIGVDSDPGCIEVAKRRAAQSGFTNVRFAVTDFRQFSPERPFDAVVGRLILMYQGDRVAAIRHCLSLLKPGGLLALQDVLLESRATLSFPEIPLYHAYTHWCAEALRRGGAHVRNGIDLPRLFEEAGVAVNGTAWGQVSADKRDELFFRYLDRFIQPFIPKIVEFGIATEVEMQAATIAERIRTDVATHNGLLVWYPIVATWAHKPS